jgi:hypothetical protein
MEKGFGAINTKLAELETTIEKSHRDLKAQMEKNHGPLVWPVRALIGGAGFVCKI